MWFAIDPVVFFAALVPAFSTEYSCDAEQAERSACVFEATFPGAQLGRFDLESHAGDVRIAAEVQVHEVAVRATTVKWQEGCTLEMGQDPERAWARVHGDIIAGAQCRLDFVVSVHPGTRLTVRIGKGDVHASGLASDFTADIGQGDLELQRIRGALDAEIGNGQLVGEFAGPRIHVEIGSGGVRLTNMVAPAAIHLGMGNVELAFAQAPIGSIDAHTGTGAIRIMLPPQTEIAADLTVGLGTKQIGLPETHDALTRIDAASDIGKVAIIPVSQ